MATHRTRRQAVRAEGHRGEDVQEYAPTRRKAFLRGALDILPMTLGVLPFGAVAGLAAISSGLNFVEAVSLSAIVNAGASQLAALQLATSGAPIAIILITTFFVNLRFLMYSVALTPQLKGVPQGWRVAMIHFVVDQTFALATLNYPRITGWQRRVAYFFGVAIPLFTSWVGGTIIGAGFGTAVPTGWSLEFAIPLVFLALLVPTIADRPALIATVVAGISAVLTIKMPLQTGLMASALIGIAAGMLAERRLWSEGERQA